MFDRDGKSKSTTPPVTRMATTGAPGQKAQFMAGTPKGNEPESTPPEEVSPSCGGEPVVPPENNTGHIFRFFRNFARKINWKWFSRQFNLGKISPDALSVLNSQRVMEELSKDERVKIVEQAQILLDHIYVHLPEKKDRYEFSPLEKLEALKEKAADMSDRNFHNQMLSIFSNLRDLHTQYHLPSPYKHTVAYLPILVESYYQDGRRLYMASKITKEVKNLSGKKGKEFPFKEGVRITHWNGDPMEEAIKKEVGFDGENMDDVLHARGLDSMTLRPLQTSLPPVGELVTVTYLADGKPYGIKFRWLSVSFPVPTGSGSDYPGSGAGGGIGLAMGTEISRRMKKSLFSDKAMKREQRMRPFLPRYGNDADDAAGSDKDSVMPDCFSFRTHKSKQYGNFAYIRIYTFDTDDPHGFVEEFKRILRRLSGARGLIIDLRGNGGGLIQAGEKLLTALAKKEVRRCLFEFIHTPLTLELCDKYKCFNRWHSSLQENGMESEKTSGEERFSDPLTLLPEDKYGEPENVFPGEMLLITDALCYSTTEFFAAAFKDNNMGTILGVDETTGGGGASVRTHAELEALLREFQGEEKLEPLPRDTEFRVALRRVKRKIGKRMILLEDKGVTCDEEYQMQRDDLLEGNAGLLTEAARLLSR